MLRKRIKTVGSAADGSSGISNRRLIIIVTGLCLTVFLVALEQVYFLKSHVNNDYYQVPTIVTDLGDSSGYTRIGTSYLLVRLFAISFHSS
jgi:hypothetical protein